MYSVRPKTPEEYVRLVDQALIELDELRACFDYDMEAMGSPPAYLDPLEAGLKRLRASMADGSYVFENRDLPFMEVANKHKAQLPFSHLLAVINHTHRNGLDVGEE